ncbi:MAG: ABC transporter ATP-binding protein [Chitinophagaceae bacterium]|nr:ABC transporter ATP-binding protein [Chitinophagaceae bacterium]MBK7124129.1 ABC transporter ATP-binding protein [Chitinophagaceae bacterium]MBK7557577.1 ABC transporter ATP-binding protein [Chitinophagaceae bacterium]MBK9532996.1 ABC transporter ATP-binding protein [Chitinophagaceae bacterium]HQW92599.1 ABC transporter ATP-binding protein [Ferruginibacter sp.]
MSNPAIIEIRNLTKTFKGANEPAVDGISFSIKRNEIFGLLGPNGAGKTTTISILCGLFPPTGGKVFIDGKDLHTEMLAIKNMIGVVPQDIALYPTLSARENLAFYGSMYGLHGKELKNNMDIWLEKLGLTDASKRQVSTYSGGMKRRVNLIAGVLHKPSILFLDEPTVGVDVQSRNVIIECLKEINAAGTTIIYTSHHMEEAQNFCTRVSIIDRGKIITEGTPGELIRNNAGSTNLENVFLNLTNRKLRD